VRCTISNFSWPVNPSTSGPVQFILDGNTEVVTQDTVTPANSIPLPVTVLDASGVPTDVARESKQDVQIVEAVSTNTKLDTLNATDFATEAKQDAQSALLVSIDSNIAALESSLNLTVVDQLDVLLLDTSSTNIPASASLPLQVVASTAAVVRKIVQIDDIGEFIGVYTGAAASEVLLAIMPLGGGEMEVNIPASTRISLRNMQNSAISTGLISINFLG